MPEQQARTRRTTSDHRQLDGSAQLWQRTRHAAGLPRLPPCDPRHEVRRAHRCGAAAAVDAAVDALSARPGAAHGGGGAYLVPAGVRGQRCAMSGPRRSTSRRRTTRPSTAEAFASWEPEGRAPAQREAGRTSPRSPRCGDLYDVSLRRRGDGCRAPGVRPRSAARGLRRCLMIAATGPYAPDRRPRRADYRTIARHATDFSDANTAMTSADRAVRDGESGGRPDRARSTSAHRHTARRGGIETILRSRIAVVDHVAVHGRMSPVHRPLRACALVRSGSRP